MSSRYHNIFGPEGTWDGGREKALQRYVEKSLKQLKKMILRLKYGAMENNQFFIH